jgi:hypothetical protein
MNARDLPGYGDTAAPFGACPPNSPDYSGDEPDSDNAPGDDVRELEVLLVDVEDFISQIRDAIDKDDCRHIRVCVQDIAGFAQKWLDTGWMK